MAGNNKEVLDIYLDAGASLKDTKELTNALTAMEKAASKAGTALMKSFNAAAKSAKRVLASFDEIERLEFPKGSGGSGKKSGSSGSGDDALTKWEAKQAIFDSIAVSVDQAKSKLKELCETKIVLKTPDIGGINAAMEKVRKDILEINSVADIGQHKSTIKYGGEDDNSSPQIAGTQEDIDWFSSLSLAVAGASLAFAGFQSYAILFPESVSAMGTAITTALKAIGLLPGDLAVIIAVVLALVAALSALAFIFHDDIIELFGGEFPESIQKVVEAFEPFSNGIHAISETIIEAFSTLYEEHLKPFYENFIDGIVSFILPTIQEFGAFFEEVMGGPIASAIENIIGLVGSLIGFLVMLMDQTLTPLFSWIKSWVLPVLLPIVDFIKTVLLQQFESVIETIANIAKILQGVIDFITGAFSGNWEKAWNGIGEIFSGFANMVIDIANGVIRITNGMLSAIGGSVNGVIGAINSISVTIPSWVPVYGGKRFGLNVPRVSFPQIPYLAQGAVLPANQPFLAMVGDQSHGTNVEAPLSTIQEALALALEDMEGRGSANQQATLEVLRQILQAVLGIQIGDETIGRAARRYERRMAVVNGGML